MSERIVGDKLIKIANAGVEAWRSSAYDRVGVAVIEGVCECGEKATLDHFMVCPIVDATILAAQSSLKLDDGEVIE